MEIAEKRKARLINLIYLALLAVIYYLFLKYAFWIVAPFIFAFLLAMALQRPIRAITGKTRLKKGPVGAVLVFLILAVVLTAVVFIGYRIGVEFKGFWDYILVRLSDLPKAVVAARDWLLQKLVILPDAVENSVREAITEFSNRLLAAVGEEEAAIEGSSGFLFSGIDMSTISSSLGGILSTAKRIPAIVTAVLVSIIACFFMTCDYDGFTGLIKRSVTPQQEAFLVRGKRILGTVLGQLIKSYATIIFITFCELSIGLNILRWIGVYNGSYIMVIAICTALLDILPVFGTGTVLVPWALYNLITGHLGLGIGLLIVYGVITVIRQVIEPRLVAMNVGLHPVLTLAGMYLGLNIFGVIGIFIVPITFVLLSVLNEEGLIHLWGAQKASAQTDAPEHEKEEITKSVGNDEKSQKNILK